MLKPIIHWDKIPGWFDYANIYDHAVKTAEDGYHFVEVGSHQGRSTAYLALEIKKSGKKIKLDACDMWTDYWDQVFLNNMKKVGVINMITPRHMFSVDAAKIYPDQSLDFIWIDADHTYEGVKEDLKAWFPKLKPNRCIAGHDYGNKDFPGVKQAVDEFFDGKIELTDSSWIHFKA